MKRFNVRVYGIILNERGELLLSDEKLYGRSFTKFPGGGIEWGEGLKDGLQRELFEELGLKTEIGDLVYVNDFFQASAFRENDQILAFYFRVKQIEHEQIDTAPKDLSSKETGESFKWVKLIIGNVDSVTFPIDRKVLQMLIDEVKLG